MKKDRTKWWHLLAFLPVIILLPVVNYIVDPGAVFRSDTQVMAKYWLQGNDVAFAYGNGDERQFKKYVILGMPAHKDCIIAGPSLSRMIQNKTVGEDDALNISVSYASFYDTMGQLGLLEALGKQYDRLVLCLDLYFFTRDESDKRNESSVFMPYADYMLKRLDGMDVSVPKPTAEQEEQISWKTKLETAFSISYFQSAVAILQANALSDGRGYVVDGDTYPGTYYRYLDCGEVFSKKLRETTASEVAADIRTYTLDSEWQEHINAYNIEYLDKLIAFLLKKGVNVQLWICPFPPSLWDHFDLKKYPSAAEIEDCVQALGKKYPEIITMGSYDPYRYNLTDADFYDHRHMRLESLEQCFDFTWP